MGNKSTILMDKKGVANIMAKWGTGISPNKEGRYLVTIKTSFGRQVRQADRVEYPKGCWHWSVLPDGGSNDVIAWQKCPKPYSGYYGG